MSSRAEIDQALMDEIAHLSSIIRRQRRNPPPGGNPWHHRPAFPPSYVNHPSATSVPADVHSPKHWSSKNRYKVDRRVVNSSSNGSHLNQTKREDKSPMKKPSPKKYEVVQKYFLKRRRSSDVSVSLGKKTGDEVVPTTPRLPRTPPHLLANRALQRSLHRLRTGRNPVCNFFKRFGKCHRMEHCPYLHVQHISQIGEQKVIKKVIKGEKPPCVFHLRGGCATIKCPFPHVTPEEERTAKKKTKEAQRAAKDKAKEAETLKLGEKAVRKPKRYYEQNLNQSSDCVKMIVPRNVKPNQETVVMVSAAASRPENVEMSDFDLLRRERLMTKVADLKRRYGGASVSASARQQQVSAPPFFPLKKL